MKSARPHFLRAHSTTAPVLEPVGFSERYEQQRTDQLTPLDNLVDAVRPDPASRSDVNRWTRSFLRDPQRDHGTRALLEQAFRHWAAAAPSVHAQMVARPLLAKADAMAERLPGLSVAGLEAVQFLSSGTKAPVGWKHRQLDLIAAARDPKTLVRFTFLASLQELVSAVQE